MPESPQRNKSNEFKELAPASPVGNPSNGARNKQGLATKKRPSLLVEFWFFLKHNKKWWLLPILIVLLLLGLLILLGGTAIAPFIYPLF